MAKPTEPQAEHTFESALTRLESLVEEMEGDRMPLEQLIVAYEEGTKLVKVCQQKLTDAEKKIEIIQRRTTEDPQLKPFDPAAKPAAKKAPAKVAGASKKQKPKGILQTVKKGIEGLVKKVTPSAPKKRATKAKR